MSYIADQLRATQDECSKLEGRLKGAHKRIAELEETIGWAIEECVAAERERKEGDGPDVRSLTQPLKGGLRAALAKPEGK